MDGDTEAVDLLDRAVQRGDGNPTGKNQHTGTVDNVNSPNRPSGNSESAALRRLRKDRPDLHNRVIGGELSAHAAAVEAGFRPKTFTVAPTNPKPSTFRGGTVRTFPQIICGNVPPPSPARGGTIDALPQEKKPSPSPPSPAGGGTLPDLR